MKRFTLRMKTNSSGLWVLGEKELLYFIMEPAMNFACEEGLKVKGFFFVGEVITIILEGAPDMVPRFETKFKGYTEYALARLAPDYENRAFNEESEVITNPVPWSKPQKKEDKLVSLPNLKDPNPLNADKSGIKQAPP